MRTLYNPETGRLVYGAKRVLKELQKSHDLFLVSYQENQRRALIKELGIEMYFTRIAFVEAKTKKGFQNILAPKHYSEIWVIGDRIEDEIALGNALRWRTIWVAQGKFKNRLPQKQSEYPTYTTPNLYRVLRIFHP